MSDDAQPAQSSSRGGQPGRSGPPHNQNARKSGAYRASGELKELISRSLDGRTTEAREVADWVGDLVSDLGGDDNLSMQRRTLVALAGSTWMQITRVDAFLARMQSLVHRKRRQLYPIVIQRQTLVATLRTLLNDLGLDRQARELPTLESYLRSKAAAAAQNGTQAAATTATATEASPGAAAHATTETEV